MQTDTVTVYGVQQYDLPKLDDGRASAFLRNHAPALGYTAGDEEDYGSAAIYLEEENWRLNHGSRDCQGSALYAVAATIEREQGVELFCDTDGGGADHVIGVCAAAVFPWSRVDWGEKLAGLSRAGFDALLDRYLVELYGEKTWDCGEWELIY